MEVEQNTAYYLAIKRLALLSLLLEKYLQQTDRV